MLLGMSEKNETYNKVDVKKQKIISFQRIKYYSVFGDIYIFNLCILK